MEKAKRNKRAKIAYGEKSDSSSDEGGDDEFITELLNQMPLPYAEMQVPSRTDHGAGGGQVIPTPMPGAFGESSPGV